MGAKASTPYPAEYAKTIEFLERLQYWTLETAKQLEKMNPDRPITKRPETDRKWKELQRPPNPLEGLQIVCEKYCGQFTRRDLGAPTNYGQTLFLCSKLFKKLNRHSLDTQIAAYEETILPLKVWALSDFPALQENLRECQLLKQKWLKLQKAQQSSPADKKLQKRAEEAKTKYETANEMRQAEWDKIGKLFWHHTWLWQMIIANQIQHHEYCAHNELKALDQCKLEEPKTLEQTQQTRRTNTAE